MSDTVTAPAAIHVDTETFVCQNCGGVMKFNIKTQKFVCGSCKAEQDLETLSDSVKEYDFTGYKEREAASVAFSSMTVASCKSCGLEISFANEQIAAVCPMCGSTQIAEGKQKAGIPPEGVVPFRIDKQDAQRKFHVWAKSRWFAPNEFKKKYQEGALSGMYLPFWTFDASVAARYEGEGGKNRQVKDKDGKTRTVTDWFPVKGTVASSFDDVPVCASDKEKRVDGILPYNTVENAKPYAAGYLSGYYAELYTIKADKAFEKAKGIMEREMKELARSKILSQYDTARIHTLRSVYSGVTYKHVLLPMWSSAFYYKGKTYGYLINGETGKVSGSRPYSAPKIAAAVIAALAVIILAVILFGGGDDAYDEGNYGYGTIQHDAVCLDERDIIQPGTGGIEIWLGLDKERTPSNGKNSETMCYSTNGPLTS